MNITVWDARILEWASTLIPTYLSRLVSRFLAHSGDSQWWLIAGAAFWYWGSDGWDLVGRRILIVTLVGSIVSGLLKRIIRRPRPQGESGLLYLEFDRHSFPSGHATRIGGLVLALGTMMPVWGTLLFGLWGLLVGLARIALGVHYPSDIAGGYLLGLVLASILLVLFF